MLARRAVANASRGLASDLVEVAQLLTSEVVTNALVHGSGPIRVEVTRSARMVSVSVDDDDPAWPRSGAVDSWATHGRGLILVESLADGWSVHPYGAGKRVWFKLRTA
jgi:anti-sigma regulatory factor (Ser/Thr protein kinase)